MTSEHVKAARERLDALQHKDGYRVSLDPFDDPDSADYLITASTDLVATVPFEEEAAFFAHAPEDLRAALDIIEKIPEVIAMLRQMDSDLMDSVYGYTGITIEKCLAALEGPGDDA